jgi:tRNA-Thr(GGU) m(6)t(6)A37 methyltransferase TsaA
VHPKRNQNLPLVGVFATRSPVRPNPMGMATVKLLEHRDNVLKVIGLDAIDGTPVLDIKPYIPGSDSPAAARTPDWLSK